MLKLFAIRQSYTVKKITTLGAIYYYKHFHKCTKGTLFLTPPPISKVYNKKC